MRWSEDDGHVSIYRQPSNNSNGHTRDREGRLISCEHDTRRVTRTEHDGSITVLIDRFNGKPLNAPNDVVVSSDGAIWFTDPLFGNLGNYEGHRITPELPTQVYRLDPKTGRATVAASGLGGPDGIAFSPDEKKLYIVDTGVRTTIGRDSNIRVFDVNGEKLTATGSSYRLSARWAVPMASAPTWTATSGAPWEAGTRTNPACAATRRTAT
jgi:gluconolactonase